MRLALLLLAVVSLFAADLEDCTAGAPQRGAVTLTCRGGAAVRIEAVTPGTLHVRTSADGKFPEPLTVRWGFVKADWPEVPVRVASSGGILTMETAEVRAQTPLKAFLLKVSARDGAVLFEQSGVARTAQQVAMKADECFYGLGFQRMALNVRGRKLQWFRTFRSAEATVPFFISSRGYGFYSNNTYRHVFDFTGANAYAVTADGGDLDFYILAGPSYKRIIDRYTSLTGRPMLAPRWALGIGYQSRYLEEQHQVVRNATGFRREDLPLDWMGLEPGWEDKPYAMKWNWSPTRFPEPESMIGQLAGMGIKMGLWESGEAPKTGYTDESARREWYKPRIDAAIRKGIKFFKQDDPYPRMISSQEWLPPELNKNLGGSGVFTAAEMNNLTNSLYSETAMREYTRATGGERAMLMFNGYNSSISSHRWPFTWEADFPLGVGALSASLSGHSLVSTRDRNEATDGIHLGYLAPFCYLESWAYYKEPWLYSEKLLDMNRFYMKLRYRLIPYLYSSARQSVETGVPMMRPMLLEFQNDPATRELATEFLLGDSLLVASATVNLTSGAEQPGTTKTSAAQKLYLPRGRWYDFWTGEAVESKGKWHAASWPAHVGGPLWVRGGAILPMGPVAEYSDQEPLDVVRLDVYPAGASRYSLYEDDGRTYGYEKGAFATTEIRCTEKPGGVALSIGARKGTFEGMPARRGYLVSLHTRLRPESVKVDGVALTAAASKESLLYAASRRGWAYENGTLWIKPAAGWRFDFDKRGAGRDADRDTVYWDDNAKAEARAVQIDIALGAPYVEKPVFGAPAAVRITSADATLIADGASTTALTATVVDAAGRRVHNWRGRIRVERQGAGKLACGDACEVEAADGVATVTLASTETPGTATLRATADKLTASEAKVRVARGVIVLKASPPERVKLNSDGAWLPLRVTLYATVKVDGVTVKSASTPLRMHVTGGAGKTPADREANAAEGIAVFPDVVFEKPPKYVMHVTGPGVEPASIPIY